MTTIASYCRITGHARNLPKPCYFPLLPPISPAEAKKLCRITGRATDLHHYSPIIAFGKPFRFDGVEGCRITQHENLNFTRPIFIKMKDNESSIENITQILSQMKHKRKKNVDDSKLFVYKITDQSTGIVIPPELEEAIRTGEIENMSISKDAAHMNLKIKQGRLVKIYMESVDKTEVDVEKCVYGEGQNKEVLEEQQKILNERNKRKQETMARKKLFEQKEQKAEDEERKAIERPKSTKPLFKFDPVRRKELLAKMGKLIEDHKDNCSIILPKYDPVSKVNPDEQIRYEKMLEDIAKAQKVSINVMTVLSTNFNWSDIKSAETGFDWDSYPKEELYDPVEVEIINISSKDIALAIKNAKTIDIAASVETVEPAPAIDHKLLRAITDIKRENLNSTERVTESLKEMNAISMLPSMSNIRKIVEEQKNLIKGYLVKEGNRSKFVEKENYIIGNETAIAGAILLIENEEKFISGQMVHLADDETFVAGQTFEDPSGGKQFIPGQTITDENGEIFFIPGHYISAEEGNTFIAGNIVDENDKLQFLSGQMIDRGDQKPVFISGQTLLTENGLKFVPGEFITDELGYKVFIPGMMMTTEDGENFIPGQVFQSEEGITFTAGQVIDTEEGPSFMFGKSFQTSEGERKFIKGELAEEEGKITFKIEKNEPCIPEIKEDLVEEDKDELIIPNEDLQLVAIIGKDISGFVVKPTNTSNIQAGERLYGAIVENDSSVLFYLNGKLPSDLSENAKVISGKLIVDETSQRFIPGKLMQSDDGDRFVPGQLVKTIQGEEFIPGQFVETLDGPKFVPGHSVLTSVGEKFIPGQVIVEEDGPRFVPGQIIQTKNGATFIPGQMMYTDRGKKFVPGQLVETRDGPRFVPGQVIETSSGPKFVSGTIVETEEGLKYLPTSSLIGIEESEEESEISFQGFDISPEEIQLLSHTIRSNAAPHTPITKEKGLIDSSTLKKLAADTMDIHGRTPEPNIDKKKKKKKKGKITIDAWNDDEENLEVQIEDAGTSKVDILKQLMKAGLTVSSFRKEKELEKLNELLGKIENYNENDSEVAAMRFINSQTPQEVLWEQYIGNDEQLIEDILFEIGDAENVKRNDEVTKMVNDAIRKCVTKKCDDQIAELIKKIIKDPDSLFTDSAAQILLTEAVGIVCVTGDVEVASLLEKFISEPNNPNCLKEDPDVLSVLRQLLVLNRIAERNPEVAKVLQELQDDPEGVKDRNKVRKFIRDAKSFLEPEKKKIDKSFDVRHVMSSKDIPTEIFEQIRQDKKEAEKFMETLPDELWKAIVGDERCGDKLIESLDSEKAGKASREMEKFRKGMAVVVAKDSVQAVIPRHYARSIYYGIMPYLLIDEEGFKFFERGLTGRKLAPAKVIENTWFQPDSYYDKSILAQQVTPSGLQYNLIFLGNKYNRTIPSLQYTSLLPSSGPTRISYLESQRRASRDGSITPLRRSSGSSTPSRRVSLTGAYDYMPSTTDSPFSRRNSTNLTSNKLSRALSPADKLTASSYSSYVPDSSLYEVNRSGTIGRLLDKYSKVSIAKEIGYHKPLITSSRYKTYGDYGDSMINGDKEDDDEFSQEERKYLPSSSISSRFSFAPENDISNKYEDKDYSYSGRDKKTLLRPFSDIYETDERDSPISERSELRSSLIATAKKNYDALGSLYESKTPEPSTTRESYTDRLRDWKNKQSNIDDESEEKPLRISHNRYESILSGEDDYQPSSYKRKGTSYDKYLENNNVGDDEEYSYKKGTSYLTKDLEDSEKKYSPVKRGTSYGNKDLEDSDKKYSPVRRGTSYGTKDLEDSDKKYSPVRRGTSYGNKDLEDSDKKYSPARRGTSYGNKDLEDSDKKYSPVRRGTSYGNKDLEDSDKKYSPVRRGTSYGTKDLEDSDSPVKRGTSYDALDTDENKGKSKYVYKTRGKARANKSLDNDVDDDDFSVEKYTNFLRQKYSRNIEDLNNTYKTPSPSRFSRFGKSEPGVEEEVSPSKNPREQISLKLNKDKKYGDKGDIGDVARNKESLDDLSSLYNSSYTGAYNSPYGYGTAQPPYYAPQMGYGQPSPYAPPGMSMYGYQPGYRGYGAGAGTGAPMYGYGGSGRTNMYTPNSSYNAPGPRYGEGYGMTKSPYSGYSPGGRTGQRNLPYGGTGRRYTTPIHLPSDDDDDDLTSYDPKKGQRKLASQIARKYVGASDSEGED